MSPAKGSTLTGAVSDAGTEAAAVAATLLLSALHDFDELPHLGEGRRSVVFEEKDGGGVSVQ